MRKDAERNRGKLIAAARDIMRSEGGDVPMEFIAERAGLTRGTLYRNFENRQEMYEAVLEHELTSIAETLEERSQTDPLGFVRHMTELMMVYDKFLVALAEMDDYDAAKNHDRMVAAIDGPLARAQAAGLIGDWLTGDDALMACRMLASHWRLDNETDPAKAYERRMRLMMRGLGAVA